MLTSFELYKGKQVGDEALDEQNINAVFKGSIKIYQKPSDHMDYVTVCGQPLKEGFFGNYPDNHQLRYILRVYCVRALGLRPKDLAGRSDPYLYLTLNDKIFNDRANYIARQVNPVFGR
ncbi:hypothetical protein JTB14_008284 [Gonioctena quinquepunctata]|nr:hypothetical protein JTB14_008284 [Gonioctena quinquepunctata]